MATALTDLLTWLDAHGAVVGILGIFVSLLLFLEARAARSRAEATVEAVPDLYGQGMLLVLVVINSGPAIARDLSMKVTLRHPTDGSRTSIHQLDRKALPVGQSLLLPRVHDEVRRLKDLAEEGFILEVVWRWKDGRKLLWVGPRRTHRGRDTYPVNEIYEGLRTSNLLTSPTTELDTLLTHKLERPLGLVALKLDQVASSVRSLGVASIAGESSDEPAEDGEAE